VRRARLRVCNVFPGDSVTYFLAEASRSARILCDSSNASVLFFNSDSSLRFCFSRSARARCSRSRFPSAYMVFTRLVMYV